MDSDLENLRRKIKKNAELQHLTMFFEEMMVLLQKYPFKFEQNILTFLKMINGNNYFRKCEFISSSDSLENGSRRTIIENSIQSEIDKLQEIRQYMAGRLNTEANQLASKARQKFKKYYNQEMGQLKAEQRLVTMIHDHNEPIHSTTDILSDLFKQLPVGYIVPPQNADKYSYAHLNFPSWKDSQLYLQQFSRIKQSEYENYLESRSNNQAVLQQYKDCLIGYEPRGYLIMALDKDKKLLGSIISRGTDPVGMQLNDYNGQLHVLIYLASINQPMPFSITTSQEYQCSFQRTIEPKKQLFKDVINSHSISQASGKEMYEQGVAGLPHKCQVEFWRCRNYIYLKLKITAQHDHHDASFRSKVKKFLEEYFKDDILAVLSYWPNFNEGKYDYAGLIVNIDCSRFKGRKFLL